MSCEATAAEQHPTEVEEDKEVTYQELHPHHMISSEGVEYIKVCHFDEESPEGLWTELLFISGDKYVVELISNPPEDLEVDLERGDTLVCTYSEQNGFSFVETSATKG